VRGPASEVLDVLKRKRVKGEITVLVGEAITSEPESSMAMKPVRAEMQDLMERQGLDERAALKAVARARGIPRSEAYRQWQSEKSTDE
jgi:16S rRNA (cytidine1402-2'-O)-methyltransferase